MRHTARSVPFFRIWSADMAYVLGYWWADGYMYIKPSTTAHEIEFASIDRDHLELIAHAIGINHLIRPVAKRSNCYELTFCSKEMYHDLAALGGTPHKSQTVEMPRVPTDLLAHFVRGVIDGDGTLVWNGDRPVIQIYSASPSFLRQLGEAIAYTTGIPAPNIATNRALYYIKWSTIRAKCLAAWLYTMNVGMALERKATIANAFLAWHPKKRPEQGTITEAMRHQFADYLPPEE